MGGLLVVIFLGTLLFVSGLILVSATDQRGRKYGMWMVAAGLFVYLVCWLFTPSNPHFHFDVDPDYYR
ncbi:MAG: hypothetical protein KF744_02220 [Taibaiella sp.]|nr:hypothetical protein [Taibaiella sp.]